MKTTKYLLITLSILIWAFGCGASSKNEKSLKDRTMEDTPDDYTPVAAILGTNPDLDTSGLDSDTNVQEEEAASGPIAQDKDYVGGNMAVFLPTVIANGEEIKATYSVVTADAQATPVLNNVKAGVETQIAPGVYDITFTTKAIAGSPDMTLRGIELTAGRRLNRKIKFPVGEITLITGGRGCKSAKILIKLKGSTDWLPGKYKTCKPIKLMAGEYEAKQGITEITGITVYDGGTRKVNIRKQ
jgi:hypothetical protein